MRLADSAGSLWPIPITLDVSEELATKLESGSKLALRDEEGVMVAERIAGEKTMMNYDIVLCTV